MKKYRIKSFNAGVDLGNGDTETSSATAMIPTAQGSNGESIILGEYYNHNKDGYVSNTQHSKRMVNYILDLIKTYPRLRSLVNENGFEFRAE